MDLQTLLASPKKHFFWLLNMLPRVRAEESLALLQILAASQSTKEGFDAIYTGLEREAGVIYQWAQNSAPKVFTIEDENAPDPEFDRAKLHALKSRHGL